MKKEEIKKQYPILFQNDEVTETEKLRLDAILDFLVANDSLSVLEMLYQKNPNVISTMNYKLLIPEICQLGIPLLVDITKYPDIQTHIVLAIKNDKNRAQSFQDIILFLRNTKKDSKVIIEQTAKMFRSNSFHTIFPIVAGKKLNLVQFENLLDILMIDDNTKINNIEELTNYQQKKEETLNQSMMEDNSLENMKTCCFKKIYHTTPEKVHHYIEKYGSSLEVLDKETPVIDYLNKINNIVNMADKQSLMAIYNSKLESKFSIMFVATVEQKLLNFFEQLYMESIYRSKESTQIDGMFGMLIHVANPSMTGFEEVDYKKKWLEDGHYSDNYLWCSYINQSNMLKFFDGKLIYGFQNIKQNMIQTMTTKVVLADINCYNPGQEKDCFFESPNQLVNHTRTNYNEIVMNLYPEGDKKLEPDYIICFDKENQLSTKVASDFGIPLLTIKREKIVEQEIQQLEILYNQAIKTLDSNQILKYLIRCENNIIGLSDDRKDLASKIPLKEDLNYLLEVLPTSFTDMSMISFINTIETHLKETLTVMFDSTDDVINSNLFYYYNEIIEKLNYIKINGMPSTIQDCQGESTRYRK